MLLLSTKGICCSGSWVWSWYHIQTLTCSVNINCIMQECIMAWPTPQSRWCTNFFPVKCLVWVFRDYKKSYLSHNLIYFTHCVHFNEILWHGYQLHINHAESTHKCHAQSTSTIFLTIYYNKIVHPEGHKSNRLLQPPSTCFTMSLEWQRRATATYRQSHIEW